MAEHGAGRVYLVGAGPGDPGLLTLRGLECLREADLVLYDGLVSPHLLRLTTAQCVRTARIRRDGELVVAQEDINHRLVSEARQGKTIVRLKGGDPFIFGRGSEEAQALAAAGIPFEVVPGITAATAAAEYAGISLTHRHLASAVAFVTGHETPDRDAPHLNYRALADFPGTLVFYMGMSHLPQICQQLIDCGKPEETPAAILCRGTLPTQRIVSATLKSLPAAAHAADLKPPSLIIIGECVNLRHEIAWFERLPLFGLSIGITRSADQASEVEERIVRLGGEPVSMPMIQITPMSPDDDPNLTSTIRSLHRFEWIIFTSVNAVHCFFSLLRSAHLDARSLASTRIATVGPQTADVLQQYGLIADLQASSPKADVLARELIPLIQTGPCLWPRASRGRDSLPEAFRSTTVRLDEMVVYQHDDVDDFTPQATTRILTNQLDWVGLSSPAIARQFAALYCKTVASSPASSTIQQPKIVCISDLTASAAGEAGLTVHAVAKDTSWTSMLDAIAESRALETSSER